MNAMTQAMQSVPATFGGQGLEEQHQYLTFMLSGETYAIGILCIKEIIQYEQMTEVPRVPAFIRGVINLRGAVVPVIDLNARLGKVLSQIERRNCIIIIEMALGESTHSVGVMVDAVNAVLEIPDSEIEPAPAFGTHIQAEFIAGMGKINGKLVIILNIRQLLSMADTAVLAEAGTSE